MAASALGGLAWGAWAETVPGDSAVAVHGIAPGDLLNVREAPSPLGKVVGRLPNGAILQVASCEMNEGNRWCRVASAETAAITGWAPARYLLLPDAAGIDEEISTSVMDTGSYSILPGDDGAPVLAATMTILPYPAERDGDAGSAPQAVPGTLSEILDRAERPSVASAGLPADILARWAAVENGLTLSGGQKLAAERTDERAAGAFAAAFASSDRPFIGTIYEMPAEDIAALPQDAQALAAESQVSTPSAHSPAAEKQGRLGRGEENAASGLNELPSAEVATASPMPAPPAQPTSRPFEAEIPCAKRLGQPTGTCKAQITPISAGASDISIEWPDGGTRQVSFRDRLPVSPPAARLSHQREGELNIIRIDGQERFEILDAIAFGP